MVIGDGKTFSALGLVIGLAYAINAIPHGGLLRRGKQSVTLRTTIRSAPDGFLSVFSQVIQVERGQKDTLFFTRLYDGTAGGRVGDRMAVEQGVGVVGHRHADGVLAGTGAELAEANFLQPAGVGGKDDFGAFQHEDARALWLFTVEADHGSHFDGAAFCIQGVDVEVIAGGHGPFHGFEVAGVDFGVGKDFFAMAVEKGKGVAGKRIPSLQIGEADGHIEFFRERGELLDIGAVGGSRKGVEVFLISRYICLEAGVADAPHFGEQGNVGALGGSLTAVLHRFFRVGLKIIAVGGELEERNCELVRFAIGTRSSEGKRETQHERRCETNGVHRQSL